MTMSAIGLILIIVAPFILLTIWALVDVSTKSFPGEIREKALWWIVALIPFIGWLIYLVLGFRRGKKQDASA